ncbi:MATE efflux family protein [Guyanagaster necrorhizus]|uniref:MATE efflux family protein n=1 Tax=Guyanagaster necrorhizus TaxID=856835 RepID=A0A9P7VPA5_9AGAR|nr:MATE efflux family protein [Guyanagaster necrorhizus MCA 3950]KAG7443546.1 MATE efflux family protein [Guyanagaster necrorhizus MCA 3950]
MASPHYQATGSLPSDYAILSRYAVHRSTNDNPVQIDTEEPEYDSESPFLTAPRPSKPTMANDRLAPPAFNEITPLLNPVIPRIPEYVEDNDDTSHESTMVMFWEEFKILTKYGIPVWGTHLLEYSLVMASVLSVGHLSTTALAAITLGSMTANVSGLSIIQGFTSALDTMLPSAWTSQPQLVGLWSQRMVVVMAVLLIPMYAIWFNAEAILLLLKQDPDVARLAAVYLRCVSFGLPAYAFNCISRRYFQSQGLFAVPTRIILIVAPINALLNYILVWGPEPIRLGFIGAPISTAISFNLVSLLSILYGVFFIPKTAWHPICRRSFTGLGVLVNLGLASVGQTASEWWAWELIGLAASLLGPVALATQSVLLVSASTTFQAPFSLSVAASVRIGNLLGERKARRAGIASNASLVMSLIMSSLFCIMFLAFRNSWGYLFNDDPAVIAQTAAILPIVAVFQVFDGGAAVSGGVLRAQGKQVTGALLNLSAYYIIGIPFGILLTFKAGMGLHGLWYGLTISLIYCAVLGTIVCIRTDWNHEVTKAMARLKQEDKKQRMEMDAEEDLID